MRGHTGVVLDWFMKANVEMVTRMVESRLVCLLRRIVCCIFEESPLLELVIKTQMPNLMKTVSALSMCGIKLLLLTFFNGEIDLIMCCFNVSTCLVAKCQAAWEQLHV